MSQCPPIIRRIEEAVHELEALITTRFSAATFVVEKASIPKGSTCYQLSMSLTPIRCWPWSGTGWLSCRSTRD